MSYEVRVYGSFKIEPELSRAEERELLEVMEGSNSEGDYCPWQLNEEADEIIPTEYETKRSLAKWLRVIVDWIVQKGHAVTGEATWEAEDNPEDNGKLVVAEGKVEVYRGTVVYELEGGGE